MSGLQPSSTTTAATFPDDREAATSAAATAVVEAELRALRTQGQQARAILADAIRTLGDSFVAMQADTTAQRSIMDSLLNSLSDTKGGLGPSEDSAVTIRQFVDDTGGVLRQFTDMLATVSAQSMKTVYRIDDMAVQLDEVFKLVASINEISQETFILAVNATIEAAHAGHAGRTFAVIASNVRDLSQRTKKFNDQIGAQIGRAQSTINEVRRIVAEMASRDLNVALTGKERVQSMLPSLEAFRATAADSVANANVVGERIATSTSAAVTALQFEDMMSQLIGSMVKRAERIGAAASGGPPPSQMGGGEGFSPVEREVRQASAGDVLSASDPVHQLDMSPGDVELF